MHFNMILLMAGTSCWCCILKFLASLLGAFALGFFLAWWLWKKYKDLVDGLERENASLRAQLTDKEKDAASFRYQIGELEREESGLKSSLRQCEADKAILSSKVTKLEDDLGNIQANAGASDLGETALGFVAGGAMAEDKKEEILVGGINYAGMFQNDNLQIVEGIGPKIEQLLKNNNITTWAGLAASPVDGLKKILTEAGPNYRIHNPKTWSEQAKLAANGDWKALYEYQKFLDTGRETTGDFDTPAKIEKLATKILGFTNKPDDLKIVEGIGPKIEQLLKAEGINNWSDLAQTKVEDIQKILDKAGSRYKLANPETWPKQAELAAANNWAELKEYQDFLSGGNTPK